MQHCTLQATQLPLYPEKEQAEEMEEKGGLWACIRWEGAGLGDGEKGGAEGLYKVRACIRWEGRSRFRRWRRRGAVGLYKVRRSRCRRLRRRGAVGLYKVGRSRCRRWRRRGAVGLYKVGLHCIILLLFYSIVSHYPCWPCATQFKLQ